MAKLKFQYISYHNYIIVYSSNLKITMLFPTEFRANFSSFRIDPKLDKYLSNAFDLTPPMQQDKAPGSEVENKDEKDIKNLFDFN